MKIKRITITNIDCRCPGGLELENVGRRGDVVWCVVCHVRGTQTVELPNPHNPFQPQLTTR